MCALQGPWAPFDEWALKQVTVLGLSAELIDSTHVFDLLGTPLRLGTSNVLIWADVVF